MSVISDHRLQVDGAYKADVLSAQDYYTFGSLMPGRGFDSSKYRYGFNGKENDNEIKGDGNQQDYGMRIYDPRIGKFLSVDPLTKHFPWNSSYAFAENRVISGIDLDGGEYIDVNGNGVGPLNEGYALKIRAKLLPGFKPESQLKAENSEAILNRFGKNYGGTETTIKAYNVLEHNHDIAMAVQIVDGVRIEAETELLGIAIGRVFKYGVEAFSILSNNTKTLVNTGYAARSFEAIVKGAETITVGGAKYTNLLVEGSAMEAFGGIMRKYGKTVDDLAVQVTKQGSSATFTVGKETFTLYNQASQGNFVELSISKTVKEIAKDGTTVKDVTKVRFTNN